MKDSQEKQYEPFGNEWEKEMSKFPKAKIISMLGDYGRLLAKQSTTPEVSEEVKPKLWKIAARIVELQKKTYGITDSEKGNIAWDMLEGEWFDYLEEELSPTK